jgi:hypothetical protein
MSMKRSKEVRRGPKDATGEEDSYFKSKTPEKKWDWETDVGAQPDEAFAAYSPRARYAVNAMLTHPKFGKGVVLDVDEQRVEVLFQDGAKKLAHGLA